MVSNADVVDHESLVLRLPADAVDPGDGLQEVVCDDNLVEVHHLFNRRIKPGEQHVVHDQNAHVAGDAVFFAAKRHLEALYTYLVLRAVGESPKVGEVVMAAGDDDVRLHYLQLLEVQLAGVALFKFPNGRYQGRVDVLLVANGRFT